jgi:hypothetical protein
MPGQNDQMNPLSRELQEMPFASLKQIGNELRTKLTEIVGDPLPVELQELLAKLEQMLDDKR